MGDGDNRAEGGGPWGRLHLSWPMLLLAGWFLYELTAQPGLGALVACAKFGWAQVRTAFWLRRVDPDRVRGQTCFWAYLTYALWKVAVMATLTMIGVGFVGSLLDRGRRQPPAADGLLSVLGGALAAAAIGFGMSLPTTYLALWSSLRHGVRLWVGPAADCARRRRFWPPCHGSTNVAPYIGFTSMVLTSWAIFASAMLVIGLAQPNCLVGLLICLGALAAILAVMIYLFAVARRVLARTPQECWGAEEGEAVYQVSDAEEGAARA